MATTKGKSSMHFEADSSFPIANDGDRDAPYQPSHTLCTDNTQLKLTQFEYMLYITYPNRIRYNSWLGTDCFGRAIIARVSWQCDHCHTHNHLYTPNCLQCTKHISHFQVRAFSRKAKKAFREKIQHEKLYHMQSQMNLNLGLTERFYQYLGYSSPPPAENATQESAIHIIADLNQAADFSSKNPLIQNADIIQSFLTTVKPVTMSFLLRAFITGSSLDRYTAFVSLMEIMGLWYSPTIASSSISLIVTFFSYVYCVSGAAQSQAFMDDVHKLLVDTIGPEVADILSSNQNIIAAAMGFAVLLSGGCVAFSNTDKKKRSFASFINSLGMFAKNTTVIASSSVLFMKLVKYILNHYGFTPFDQHTADLQNFIESVLAKETEVSEALTQVSEEPQIYLQRPAHFRALITEAKDIETLYHRMPKDVDLRREGTNIINLMRSAAKLKEVCNRVDKMASMKQVPTVLYISGVAGTGKSYLTEKIIDRLSFLEGEQLSSYSRNTSDKFWSGYCQQPIVIVDDFGKDAENRIEPAELISMSTPQPYLLSMADLESKGMFFRSRYIIYTSNYYSTRCVGFTEAAIERRKDVFITLENPTLNRWVVANPNILISQYPHKDTIAADTTVHNTVYRDTIATHTQRCNGADAVDNIAQQLHAIENDKRAEFNANMAARLANLPQMQNQTSVNTCKVSVFLGDVHTGKTFTAKGFVEKYPQITLYDEGLDDFDKALRIVTEHADLGNPCIITCNEEKFRQFKAWCDPKTDTWRRFQRRANVFSFKWRTSWFKTRDYTNSDVATDVQFFHGDTQVTQATMLEQTLNVTRTQTRTQTELEHVFKIATQHTLEFHGKQSIASVLSQIPPSFLLMKGFRAVMSTFGAIQSRIPEDVPPAAALLEINNMNLVAEIPNVTVIVDNQEFLLYQKDGLVTFAIPDLHGGASTSEVFSQEDAEDLAYIKNPTLPAAFVDPHIRSPSYVRVLRVLDVVFSTMQRLISSILVAQNLSAIYEYLAEEGVPNERKYFETNSDYDQRSTSPQERYQRENEPYCPESYTPTKSRKQAQFSRESFTPTQSKKQAHFTRESYTPTKSKKQAQFQREGTVDEARQAARVESEGCVDSTFRDNVLVCEHNIIKFSGCYAFMVKGHFGVTANHCLPHETTTTDVDINGEIHHTTVTVVNRLPDKDICVFQLDKKLPMFRDVVSKFPKKGSEVPKHYPAYMIMEKKYLFPVQLQSKVRVVGTLSGPVNVIRTSSTSSAQFRSYVSQPGDCGSPIIALDNMGSIVAGIHVGGTQYNGYVASVCQEDLFITNQSSSNLSFHLRDGDQIDPVETQDYGNALLLGNRLNFKGDVASKHLIGKTRVTQSPLKTDRFEQEFVPPILYTEDPRHNGGNILKSCVDKWNRERPEIDRLEWRKFYQDLATEYSRRGTVKIKMRTLTKQQALNGINIPESSSINIATSPGFPYNTWPGMQGKHSFIEFSEEHNRYMFRDTPHAHQFLERYEQLFQCLKDDETPVVIFDANLKDEPLKKQKAEAGGTRAFIGAPFDFVFAQRVMNHAGVCYVMANRDNMPIKIGMAPNTAEWDRFITWMEEVGHRYVDENGELRGDIFDGDYPKFDASVINIQIEELAEFFNTLYTLEGRCTEADRIIRRRMFKTHALMLIIYGALVLCIDGGEGSGEGLTIFTDSAVNCGNLYFAAKSKYPNLTVAEWLDKTRVGVCGDDHIVNPGSLDLYTYANTKSFLATIGFGYTPADKSECEEYKIHIEQAEFLKRKTQWVELANGTKIRTGALLDNSFSKMTSTTWGKAYYFKGSLHTDFSVDKIVSTIDSYLLESSLRGEEFYNESVSHVLKVVRDYDLPYVSVKTWLSAFYTVYYGKEYFIIDSHGSGVSKPVPIVAPYRAFDEDHCVYCFSDNSDCMCLFDDFIPDPNFEVPEFDINAGPDLREEFPRIRLRHDFEVFGPEDYDPVTDSLLPDRDIEYMIDGYLYDEEGRTLFRHEGVVASSIERFDDIAFVNYPTGRDVYDCYDDDYKHFNLCSDWRKQYILGELTPFHPIFPFQQHPECRPDWSLYGKLLFTTNVPLLAKIVDISIYQDSTHYTILYNENFMEFVDTKGEYEYRRACDVCGYQTQDFGFSRGQQQWDW